MQEFKKVSLLNLKKHKMWIIMLALLTILLSVQSLRWKITDREVNSLINLSNIQTSFDEKGNYKGNSNYDNGFSYNYDNPEKDLKELAGGEIKEDFIDKEVRRYYKILDHYNLDENELEKWYDGPWEDIPNGLDELYQFSSFKENYISQDKGGLYKFDVTSSLFSIDGVLIAFIIILSFLFTSVTHLTKYFDFTQMLPWKKEKTWTSSYFLGVIILSILWILDLIFKYLLIKSTAMAPCTYVDVFSIGTIENYLKYIVVFTICMAAGAMAGNIIGHIGLICIGFLGIDLFSLNILGFLGEYISESSVLNKLYDLPYKLPIYLRGIICPYRMILDEFRDESFIASVSISYVIAILAFFLLGYYLSKKAKAERSQMLVLDEKISNFSYIMAIITTTNIIFNFSQVVGGEGLGIAFEILSILIGAFLSHRFYKFLFKARIGFN